MNTLALEQFNRIFSEIPFNRILGLNLVAIEKDFAVLNFSMKDQLIGNYMQGILHGGVISAVLDMAGGAAAMAHTIQKNKHVDLAHLTEVLGKASTINLHIDYLRPGKGDGFLAKASIVHSGNKITFTHMELHNQESVLIASGSAAYRIG